MSHRDSSPGLQADRIAHLKRTPLLAVVAFFILGILISDCAAASFAAWAVLAVGGLGLVVGGLCFRRAAAATLGVLLTFCAAGGAIYLYRCQYIPPGHVTEVLSDERALMKVRGYVCSDPVSRQKLPLMLAEAGGTVVRWETAFDVRLNAIISASGVHRITGKTKVKLYVKNPGIRYGDELILTGQIQTPNTPTNPFQFDYREYLRRRGIRAVLYVGTAAGIDWTGRSKGRLLRRLHGFRRRLVSLVAAPSNGDGGKMLAAMLLGAREELPPDVEESFRQSGTVHLLAISGLHVGMVAVAVWLVMGITGAPERLRSIVVILCVVCYVFISGTRPPAVRAAVMVVLVALGGLVNRRQITINSLALAALVILIFSPGEIFMRGFQLSFLAVLAIVHFYRPVRALLDRLKSPLEKLQAPEERSVALAPLIVVNSVEGSKFSAPAALRQISDCADFMLSASDVGVALGFNTVSPMPSTSSRRRSSRVRP